MGKKPKWEDDFLDGVVNSNPEGVRRAVALGLPINQHVLGGKTLTPLHKAVQSRATPGVINVGILVALAK
jgi:hypothetical protein